MKNINVRIKSPIFVQILKSQILMENFRNLSIFQFVLRKSSEKIKIYWIIKFPEISQQKLLALKFSENDFRSVKEKLEQIRR